MTLEPPPPESAPRREVPPDATAVRAVHRCVRRYQRSAVNPMHDALHGNTWRYATRGTCREMRRRQRRLLECIRVVAAQSLKRFIRVGSARYTKRVFRKTLHCVCIGVRSPTTTTRRRQWSNAQTANNCVRATILGSTIWQASRHQRRFIQINNQILATSVNRWLLSLPSFDSSRTDCLFRSGRA